MRTSGFGPTSRTWRFARLGAALVFLAAAVTATTLIVVANGVPLPGYTSGKQGSAATTPITGQKGKQTCDGPDQPTCAPLPPLPNTWVRLASEAPTDVVAALQKSPGFQSPIQDFSLPSNTSVTWLTTPPVLVLPATRGSADPNNDMAHWIVQASINGKLSVTYDLLYDRANSAIKIVTFGMKQPNDPGYDKAFPWYGDSASAALAAVQSERQVALAQGTQAQLVYFAGDNAKLAPVPGQAPSWTGGGDDATRPIWRIKGANGGTYFVGIDGKTYLPSDLPAEAGVTVLAAQ
jgi:hypothetical protein